VPVVPEELVLTTTFLEDPVVSLPQNSQSLQGKHFP